METRRRGVVMGIAWLFICGGVAIPLAVISMFFTSPRYFFSKVTVELKSSYDTLGSHFKSDGPPPIGGAARSHLPGDLESQGWKQVPQTDLAEFGVWDRDPLAAATKANETALALRVSSPNKVLIREPAEPALRPMRPSVLHDLVPGIVAALLSLFLGFVLLAVTLSNPQDGRTAGLIS